MSFYVSESIKDILTEDQVSVESDLRYTSSDNLTLFFLIDGVRCGSKVIKLTQEYDRYFKVGIETNANILEQIFFKKVEVCEIVIGSTCVKAQTFKFLKAHKKKEKIRVDLLLEVNLEC